MGKTIGQKISSGFSWMLLGQLAQYLLQFGTLMVLARLLDPHDFGVVSAALVVLGVVGIVAELGVGPALVQRASIGPASVSTALGMSLFLGVFFGGLVAASAGLCAMFFRMPELAPVLQVVALTVPVAALSVVGQSLLQRKMEFRVLAAGGTASYFCGYVLVGVPMALLGHGVWALAFAYMVQTAVMTLLVWFFAPHSFALRFDREEARALLYFGGGHSLSRIGNYLANQGDNVVVGRLLGAAALGIYGRAYNLMVLPANVFGTVMDKVLFPAMARFQDNEAELRQLYVRAIGLIALFSFPLSAVLVVLGEDIILLLLGGKWQAAVLPFQILAACLAFRVSYKMSDVVVRAKGAVYKRAWRQFIYAAMVLGLAALGARYGIGGVAAGVGVAVFVNFVLMLELSQRLLGFDRAAVWWIQLKYLLLGAGTALACFIPHEILGAWQVSRGLTLVLSSLAAALPFVAILWWRRQWLGDEGDLIYRLLKPRLSRKPEAGLDKTS